MEDSEEARTEGDPAQAGSRPRAQQQPASEDQPWMGNLAEMVQFAEGGIVSKTLVDRAKANVSLFAMRTGQTMSGHSASNPATIHVLSGAGVIRIGDTEYEGRAGSLYYLPAGLYHALTSTDDLVFLLDLFR
jgi:quercetin dioxygenase-like cupin family protein